MSPLTSEGDVAGPGFSFSEGKATAVATLKRDPGGLLVMQGALGRARLTFRSGVNTAKVIQPPPAYPLEIGKQGRRIPVVTYAEALDEALCFGWIDGLRRRKSGRSQRPGGSGRARK